MIWLTVPCFIIGILVLVYGITSPISATRSIWFCYLKLQEPNPGRGANCVTSKGWFTHMTQAQAQARKCPANSPQNKARIKWREHRRSLRMQYSRHFRNKWFSVRVGGLFVWIFSSPWLLSLYNISFADWKQLLVVWMTISPTCSFENSGNLVGFVTVVSNSFLLAPADCLCDFPRFHSLLISPFLGQIESQLFVAGFCNSILSLIVRSYDGFPNWRFLSWLSARSGEFPRVSSTSLSDWSSSSSEVSK